MTRTIPTRRLDLEPTFADLPRHFAGDGDLIGSHLAMALSSVFPDGEDYFVRSVRRYRDRITERELKRQVAGFIGQEAVHGREHRDFNARLAELGYPTERFEAVTRWYLGLRERILPPLANLATTAALEHFTATLAELVLSSEEARATFGHPAVQDLFTWHALEESEHKAVAFDVYRSVGGPEWLRILVMKEIRAFFVLATATGMIDSLLHDPAARRPGNLRASWRRFVGSPLMTRGVWRQLRDYDRRGFHPDDRDTTALLEEWRERLFGSDGRLNERLSGPAA